MEHFHIWGKGELAHIKFGRFSIQKPELWVWQTNTGKEKGNQRQNKYLRNDSLQESETRRQGRWTPPRDTERIPAAVGEITVPRKHADRMIAWQHSRATPQKALQTHAGRWARCRKLPSARPLLNTSINEEKSSLLQNVKLWNKLLPSLKEIIKF